MLLATYNDAPLPPEQQMTKQRGFLTKGGKYQKVFPRQEREEPYLVPHKRLSRYAIVRLRFRWKLVGGRWYVDKRIPPIWRKVNREKDIYQESVELFMQMDSDRRKRYKERDAHELRHANERGENTDQSGHH